MERGERYVRHLARSSGDATDTFAIWVVGAAIVVGVSNVIRGWDPIGGALSVAFLLLLAIEMWRRTVCSKELRRQDEELARLQSPAAARPQILPVPESMRRRGGVRSARVWGTILVVAIAVWKLADYGLQHWLQAGMVLALLLLIVFQESRFHAALHRQDEELAKLRGRPPT